MEPKKPHELPPEVVELYNEYIHGGMSRREFLDATKRFAVGGLTAAAIVEAMMPNYALGEQVPKDDKRLKTEYVTVPSPQGNGKIKGYLVRPANAAGKLPGVLVVHENRGLNPHIEDVASASASRTSWPSPRTALLQSAVIRATTTKAANFSAP